MTLRQLVRSVFALYPTLEFEKVLWAGGFTRLAGIDEAGRGAWAGPVCAAAVILPPHPGFLHELEGVRDSKLMTPRSRQVWAPRIKAAVLAWGVGFSSVPEIDLVGILAATKLAAGRAMESLDPDYLLTDFLVFRSLDLPQTALVKGDQLSLSVAAASVLAKTERDALMVEMGARHPQYGFAQHKGYGTRLHRDAIQKWGLCESHRKSFSLPAPSCSPDGPPYLMR